MAVLFWQDVVLAVLLVPYGIGICISTYYAQKQKRDEPRRPRNFKDPKNDD
jgi:hypothetical protein